MTTRLRAVLLAGCLLGGVAHAQSEPPLVTDEQAGDVDNDGAEQQQGDQGYGYVEAQQDPSQPQVDGQPYGQQQYEAPPAEDAEPTAAVNTVSSVQDFEPGLAPYGNWVNTNGVRAWQPAPAVVGANFTPYMSNGQWVSTEAGWSFSSRLPFAWATYHYGRWWQDPVYGWVWVPDTVWGPSWVEWRYGGGYAGWAPLPPPLFVRWHRPRWTFVSSGYLCSRDLYRYSVPAAQYGAVFSVTAVLPTRSYYGASWHVGPSWREVARVSVVPPLRTSMTSFVPRHGATGVMGAGYVPHGSGAVQGGYRPPTASGYVPPPTSYHPPSSGGYVSPPTSSYRPPSSGGYVSPPSSYHPPPSNGGYTPPPTSGYHPPPPSGGYSAPSTHPSGGYVAPSTNFRSSPLPSQSHQSVPSFHSSQSSSFSHSAPSSHGSAPASHGGGGHHR